MKKIDAADFLKAFKEKAVKDKKALLTVLIGILGMVLILVSSFTESAPERAQAQEIAGETEEQLKKELEGLLSSVGGAGRVKVMLTFESSEEKIYASDTDESNENRSGSENQHKIKSEHIIIKAESGEQGLLIKDVYPRVRGVAVVCDGAANAHIKGQIISIVSALFDINSTKISVAEMAD